MKPQNTSSKKDVATRTALLCIIFAFAGLLLIACSAILGYRHEAEYLREFVPFLPSSPEETQCFRTAGQESQGQLLWSSRCDQPWARRRRGIRFHKNTRQLVRVCGLAGCRKTRIAARLFQYRLGKRRRYKGWAQRIL